MVKECLSLKKGINEIQLLLEIDFKLFHKIFEKAIHTTLKRKEISVLNLFGFNQSI